MTRGTTMAVEDRERERLSTRRAIFRSLMSSSRDAWLLLDGSGVVQAAGPNWTALGIDPKSMVGRHARSFIRGLFGVDGPLDDDKLPPGLVVVFDQPSIFIARGDGALAPAVVRAARLRMLQGTVVALSVNTRKRTLHLPAHDAAERGRQTVERISRLARHEELARGIGASALVALRALDAQAFHLLELAGDGLLIAHAVARPDLITEDTVIPFDAQSAEGQALRSGRPVVIADTWSDQRVARSWWPKKAASGLIVPLRVRERIVGLIEIWASTARAFTDDDVPFGTAVADLMATSLHALAWQSRVRAHREQLRRLSRQLMSVQEAERRHIACELHDELGQVLTALKMELAAAARGGEETARGRIDGALAMVDRMIGQVRSISLDLRPPGLDELGLAAALRYYVAQMRDRTGLDISLTADTLAERPPAAVEQACFRIVQEAVNNAVKHAAARRVRVVIAQRGNTLGLSVSDDGRGFDVDAAQARGREGASLGLIGMRERAEIAGGRLHVRSSAGRGTTITAQLSCRSRTVAAKIGDHGEPPVVATDGPGFQVTGGGNSS